MCDKAKKQAICSGIEQQQMAKNQTERVSQINHRLSLHVFIIFVYVFTMISNYKCVKIFPNGTLDFWSSQCAQDFAWSRVTRGEALETRHQFNQFGRSIMYNVFKTKPKFSRNDALILSPHQSSSEKKTRSSVIQTSQLSQ